MDSGRSRAQLVAELVVTLVAVWMTLPDHRRREILMRMVTSTQKLTERLAQRLGRAGMRDELKGSENTAQVSYEAAYGLMTGPRVRLEKLYDQLRGAIT